MVAPRLSYELLSTALGIASALPAVESYNHSPRARALAALAPHLPHELLGDALIATYPFQDAEKQASALIALARPLTSLSPTALYPLWQRTLHILVIRNRANLLAGLAVLVPVITKLGSQESLLKAALDIVDIASWWP